MMVKKFGVFRKTELEASLQVYRNWETEMDTICCQHNKFIGAAKSPEEAEQLIDSDIEDLREHCDKEYSYAGTDYSLETEAGLSKLKSEMYFVAEIYVWSPD